MRSFDYDADERWIVENDGEGCSQIVARDVLPEFGVYVIASLDRTSNRDCWTCGDPVYCASCAKDDADGD